MAWPRRAMEPLSVCRTAVRDEVASIVRSGKREIDAMANAKGVRENNRLKRKMSRIHVLFAPVSRQWAASHFAAKF